MSFFTYLRLIYILLKVKVTLMLCICRTLGHLQICDRNDCLKAGSLFAEIYESGDLIQILSPTDWRAVKHGLEIPIDTIPSYFSRANMFSFPLEFTNHIIHFFKFEPNCSHVP